jgi:hypothetical protein
MTQCLPFRHMQGVTRLRNAQFGTGTLLTVESRVECRGMDISQYVDEPTLTALTRSLPNVPLEPKLTHMSGSSEPFVSVVLPAALNAEYRFSIALRPEKQIAAELLNAREGDYFWYRPFEDAEFSSCLEKLEASFFDTVDLLVSHETRIVQERGWLWHKFQCDYKPATGWKEVYAHSALRLGGGFRVPTAGKKRIYYSPALLPR